MSMVDAGVQRFYMRHGGPLSAKEMRRHALSLRHLKPGRKYGMPTVGCACFERKLTEFVDDGMARP
jgi:hypothetical protein